MAVKGGRGGSLLKDLKVLQRSQRPKTNSVLKADNDQDRIVSAEDKLERWQRHFEIATYVPTEITDSSLGRTPQASQHGVDEDLGDEVNSMLENKKLVCVPTEWR